MSNINASEDNVESPSTYVGDAYKEYRKNERRKREEKEEEKNNKK
ncbi:MAG TPA: hypothetical protein VFM28_01590 [Nitrososphaeraceae archaeon]|jgi:hypothetical protein|nr:hypothetical protein [Nitrososphaeraceae archaeon]